MKEPKPLNVYQDTTGKKFVVPTRDIQKIKDNPTEYTFVCEKPHDDDDYSYLCFGQYCRCHNS